MAKGGKGNNTGTIADFNLSVGQYTQTFSDGTYTKSLEHIKETRITKQTNFLSLVTYDLASVKVPIIFLNTNDNLDNNAYSICAKEFFKLQFTRYDGTLAEWKNHELFKHYSTYEYQHDDQSNTRLLKCPGCNGFFDTNITTNFHSDHIYPKESITPHNINYVDHDKYPLILVFYPDKNHYNAAYHIYRVREGNNLVEISKYHSSNPQSWDSWNDARDWNQYTAHNIGVPPNGPNGPLISADPKSASSPNYWTQLNCNLGQLFHNDVSNIMLLCAVCNVLKGRHVLQGSNYERYVRMVG